MKHFFPLLLFLGLASACTPSPEKALKLHYNQPAGFFEEALPLGNGTLGALVYGGPETDRISLNDISLWTGEPDRGPDHPDYGLVSTLTPWDEISSWLPQIREALDQEDYPKADELQRKLQGHNSEMYQPLGQLEITYPEGEITDYYRELDLATAKATVRYKRNGKAFQAEYFVSAPDSVVVIRLRHQTKADNNALVSDGYTAWHVLQEGKTVKFYDPNRGIHYRTVVTCPQAQVQDSTLQLSGVKEALLVVANHTSYNGFDKDPVKEGREYKEASIRDAQAAVKKGWSRLQKDHLKDYQALFGRVSLDLGSTAAEIAALPTDQQLMRYADGENNPELEALYFQFGRYLHGRHPRQPAGSLEREHGPAVALQLHHQHQPGRELLGRRSRRPAGNAPGAAGLRAQPVPNRRPHREGVLRRGGRLVPGPQQRPLGHDQSGGPGNR